MVAVNRSWEQDIVLEGELSLQFRPTVRPQDSVPTTIPVLEIQFKDVPHDGYGQISVDE
jgi:hypothetical protein